MMLLTVPQVYYREQAASTYNPWAYSMTTSVVEIPYLVIQVRS
jgi:hypothetical protein